MKARKFIISGLLPKGAFTAAVVLAALPMAQAATTAVRDLSALGFTSTVFPGNDDGSVGPISLGFTADFYTATGQTSVHVNNNGNVTFVSPLGSFTPFPLSTSGLKMLAPFWADIDTRPAGSGPVTYGTGTIGGHAAFAVNWLDVGYYSFGTDKKNDIQLVMISRSDTGAGNFDFEFTYNKIQWETGSHSSSGGSGGLGGFSARAGYTDGTVTNSFELAGSAVNGAFLDTGPAGTALILNKLGASFDDVPAGRAGRYTFQVRGSSVVPTPVPDSGATVAMFGLALLALVGLKRKFA